jgi:hypothetical protein
MKQTTLSKVSPFTCLLIVLFTILHCQMAGAECIQGNCSNGTGTFQWPDGNRYSGSFVDGLMHGKGTFTWKNGNVYSGEYRAGKRDGYGVFTWQNGNRYTGTFSNGSIHGKGIFHFNSGETYEGAFENGVMHGEGTLLWPNGDRYVGSFFNGRMNGIGTFTWKNGDTYTGMFRDELMSGDGIFKWKNGRRYEGSFSYRKAGVGTLTDVDGTTVKGLLRMGGRIVSIIRGSQGEEHGFLPDDIVTAYNNIPLIGGGRDLANMAANTPASKKVTVTIIRNGKIQKIEMHGGRIGIELIDYPYFEPDRGN